MKLKVQVAITAAVLGPFFFFETTFLILLLMISGLVATWCCSSSLTRVVIGFVIGSLAGAGVWRWRSTSTRRSSTRSRC